MPDNQNNRKERSKENTPGSSVNEHDIKKEKVEDIPQLQPVALSEQTTISQSHTTTFQQTENMEVHKHAHHVMHGKKWPEYLLENKLLNKPAHQIINEHPATEKKTIEKLEGDKK